MNTTSTDMLTDCPPWCDHDMCRTVDSDTADAFVVHAAALYGDPTDTTRPSVVAELVVAEWEPEPVRRVQVVAPPVEIMDPVTAREFAAAIVAAADLVDGPVAAKG